MSNQARLVSGWLIERYIGNKLHFWCARGVLDGCGDSKRGEFSSKVSDAVLLARESDAIIVLYAQCGGEGRVAEHVWTETREMAE